MAVRSIGEFYNEYDNFVFNVEIKNTVSRNSVMLLEKNMNFLQCCLANIV